ncbi:MAG TPA: phospholipase D-like domain-containing protein [Candidatus Rubrimentiphilum sp.]|nr:phospholipase D-like domain-containing protein [Candidatus Rubrimentiphilum sp.]
MRNVSMTSSLGDFVIGVNDRITTFEAVCLLLKYGASVFLYRDSDTLKFHPKGYYFCGTDRRVAYVGSSNLTDPGWVNNVELSVRLENNDTDQVKAYIDDLKRSEFALTVSTVEDAERAKTDGYLVTERDARDRREENGAIGRAVRPPLPGARQRRNVAVDRQIRDDARALFAALAPNGFVLLEPALDDIASFVTDLGLSEANRLTKILTGDRASGTFEVNIAVNQALSAHPTFWGWPREFAVPPGRKHSEFRPRVRLKTHLTPSDGVLTEGRLWVRTRGANPTAELRFEIGTADVRRRYFDSSIDKKALVRIDRLADNVYDVTVIRPNDGPYYETAALLEAASPGHRFGYF